MPQCATVLTVILVVAVFFWPSQELETPRCPGMLSVTRLGRDGSTDPPWLVDAARSDSSDPSANNFQQ